MNQTEKKDRLACPRCGLVLVPVHARGDRERRVLELACPEPYCDYVQPTPAERRRGPGARRLLELSA